MKGWKSRTLKQGFVESRSILEYLIGTLVRGGSTVEVTGDEVILLNLDERRHINRTPSMRVGTASVEPAARRRINGARYFSTEHVTPLMTRVHDRNRGYERLSVRM